MSKRKRKQKSVAARCVSPLLNPESSAFFPLSTPTKLDFKNYLSFLLTSRSVMFSGVAHVSKSVVRLPTW